MKLFEIQSISAGWMMGCLRDGEKEHYFDYSYLTNFPEDLMKVLLYFSGNILDEKKDSFRAEWEPAVDVWKVSLDNSVMSFNIKNYEDGNADQYDEEIILQCEYTAFLKDFVSEMDAVIKRFGILGYRYSWGYEFPMSLFLKLKDICSGNNALNIEVIPKEENMGCEAGRTDIGLEMEIIQRN